MLQYIADLDARFEKNQSNEIFDKIKEAVWLSDRFGGSEVAKALVARRERARRNDSLASFMLQRIEESGQEELTPGQKVATEAMYNKIKNAQAEYDKYVAEREKELTDREAALKFEEIRKKAGSKRSTKDLAKERDDIVSSILEKFARKDDNPSFFGVSKLAEVAPDVLKLARNLVESGVKELGELVEKIKEVINPSLPKENHIEDSEIRQVVAGKFNKELPPKTEVMERWHDLKEEAKLIEQLEALNRGEEPVSKRRSEKRNKKIEELRAKLKEHPLTKDSEQRKSDARRKADLELKLAKLDAGIEPDITPKEKKEMSDEVKELQRKIKEHDIQKLSDAKKKIQSEIAKYKSKIDKGEFSVPKEDVVELDEKGKEMKRELNGLKNDWQVMLLKEKYKRRTSEQKALDKVAKVMNIPRSLMASMDFSAVLNQGLIPVLSHPGMAIDAIGQMFKSGFSEKEFNNWFEDIRDTPMYNIAKDSKLRLTDPASPFLEAHEETFGSGYSEIALDKVFGRTANPIRISERAYTQFLNKMRFDLFSKLANKWADEGKTINNSKKLYEFTAKFVNDITGSGNLPFKLEQYAGIFNAAFFSPRMMISRLRLLSGYYLWKGPKELRMEYLKEMGKSMSAVSAVVGAFYLKGLTQSDDDPNKFHVSYDPRSSDFMKVRQGNTRWNPLGGFQPIVRVASQLFTGQRRSASSGALMDLGGDSKFGQTVS